MRIGDVIKSALGGGLPTDVKNIDMPLSGDSANTLNELISRGVFKDKSDFLSFAAKAYMQNNLGAAMSGASPPPESAVLDIINKAGINKGFGEADTKKMLVPLLIAAFTAIYRYMSRRKEAAKPA